VSFDIIINRKMEVGLLPLYVAFSWDYKAGISKEWILREFQDLTDSEQTFLESTFHLGYEQPKCQKRRMYKKYKKEIS
jgi:hypothetical protein